MALSRPPRAASRTHPVYGNHPNKHYLVPIRLLDKALEEVDLAVRDARFDPFTVHPHTLSIYTEAATGCVLI